MGSRWLALGLALGVGALAASTPFESSAATPCVVLTTCTEPVPEPLPPAPPPTTTPPTTAPPPSTTTTTTAPRQPTEAEAEARLLELLNAERRRAGLAALAPRADVAEIAHGWSSRMAETQTLAHNAKYFDPETRRRLGARRLGENVARNADVTDAHRQLMASAGHRSNILNGAFEVVGLGAVHRNGQWWVTQNFVEPRHRTPVVEVARTPAPAARGQHRAASPTNAIVEAVQRPSAPAAMELVPALHDLPGGSSAAVLAPTGGGSWTQRAVSAAAMALIGSVALAICWQARRRREGLELA